MAIYINPFAAHEIVAANFHYYKEQTEAYYINRVLEFHDFIYLIEGSWSITEGSQEYRLEPGDVLLLAAGKHHFTRQPCQAGTKTFCVHITRTPSDLVDIPGSLFLPSHISLAGNRSVRFLFEEIISTKWSDGPYQNEKLSALFNLLIYELAAIANTPINRQSDLADHAISYLMQNPYQRIQTSDMAKMLYVSEKKLNRSMREKTGMPFYTYQKSLKLDMIAAQLKTEPHLRINEIAEAFGFHDEFHLSNAFKKKFGISPQKYRTAFFKNLFTPDL